MSHFKVFVIGDNISAQLQPFHEFECTGIDDEYVIDVDNTEKMQEEWRGAQEDFHQVSFDQYLLGDDWTIFANRAVVIKTGQSKYRYAFKDPEGETRTFRRTNPNSKWDSWVIGGRFNEALLLKSGIRSNQALRGKIDFEKIFQQHHASAREMWENVRDVVPIDLWNPVSSFGRSYREYWEQRALVILKDDPALCKTMMFMNAFEIDSFLRSKEEHADATAYGWTTPYAFVRDGKWSAKGEMGWWGVSKDGDNVEAWEKAAYEMLLSLADDTLITVVDCHI